MQVQIIVNPVSGTHRDVRTLIETVCRAHDNLDWEIHETHGDGDARRFAERAVLEGADLVIACGGDGTVMEVASGVSDSGVPMAILPAGTANVMAIELGIPLNVVQALYFALDAHQHGTGEYRHIDMGMIDNQPFLLRCGIGYEAEVSTGADRAAKQKWGRFAYFFTAWRKLHGLRPVRYKLTLDGEVHVVRGITCLICNSSSLGMPNLGLVQDGYLDDGKLDVIVIHSFQLRSMIGVIWSVLRSRIATKEKPIAGMDHFQAKHITVKINHRQRMARDGEPLKRGKRVTARVLPGVLRVLVPVREKAGVMP